jgi:serum/glucocorticoid-regulated kinase 2
MAPAKGASAAASPAKGGAAAGGGATGEEEAGNFTMKIEDRFATNKGAPLSVDDFNFIKVLGRGSFGKVMLCRKKDEGPQGQLYAMKTLRKQALVKRNQLTHTQTERNILQNIQHPFLVNLKFAFQTADKLYMVLEYMGGGELFHWLKQHRKFSEPRGKLYAAEICLALEVLHSKDMIYRDLKPENILLDLEGHLRLTDFGLAKDQIQGAGAVGGTKTFCGTPEYLAPEILENKGHGKAVDWWSFGTLVYEMICGLPPFYDTNVQRMYHKILHAPLRFPSYLTKEAKDCLNGLLQRKVEARLGSKLDAVEIKEHAWFSDLDWGKVYRKETVPEFAPGAGKGADYDGSDATHFDEEFTNEKAIDSVVNNQLSATMVEKSKFEGFTFAGGALDDINE